MENTDCHGLQNRLYGVCRSCVVQKHNVIEQKDCYRVLSHHLMHTENTDIIYIMSIYIYIYIYYTYIYIIYTYTYIKNTQIAMEYKSVSWRTQSVIEYKTTMLLSIQPMCYGLYTLSWSIKPPGYNSIQTSMEYTYKH